MNIIKTIENYTKNRKVIIERMPAIPHTVNIPASVMLKELDKLGYGWGFIIIEFEKENIRFLFPIDEQIDMGKRFLKDELKEDGNYLKIINEWKIDFKSFKKECEKIDSINFEDLTNIDLKQQYEKFIKIFRKAWAMPLTATAISYYSNEIYIPKLLKKYQDIENFLELAKPIEPSFINEEEKELLKIKIEIINEIKNKTNYKKEIETDFKNDIINEINNNPKIIGLLKNHQKKYFWINNNYRDFKPLEINYFIEQLVNIKESVNKESKTTDFIFNKEEKTMAKLIGQATTFQDLRKKTNLIGNHYIGIFLEMIGKRFGYSEKELHFTLINEVKDLLNGKKLDKQLLNERIKHCINIVNDKEDILITRNKAKLVSKLLDRYEIKTDIIKGLVASKGDYKGIARVILDPKKIKEFNEGDIIITSMTRPDFTPLMKKAGAIICDEGGITSHASIVSRELGIPCIIGTKVASKIIKNGDYIEIKDSIITVLQNPK